MVAVNTNDNKIFGSSCQFIGNSMPVLDEVGEQILDETAFRYTNTFNRGYGEQTTLTRRLELVPSITATTSQAEVLQVADHPPMPESRYLGAAAVLNNKIYYVGGLHDYTLQPTIYAFSPQFNRWTKKKDFLFPIENHSLVTSLANKLYLFGGNAGEGSLNEVYLYDEKRDKWQQVATMKEHAENQQAVCATNGQIYLIAGESFGGTNDVEKFGKSWVFHPTTKEFSSLPAMNIPRTDAAVVEKDDHIYAIGGRDNLGNVLDTVEVLDINSANPVWETLPERISPRYNAQAMVTEDNQIVLMGGKTYSQVSGSSVLKSVQVLKNGTWTHCPDLQFPRSDFQVVRLPKNDLESTIHVIGGAYKVGDATIELKTVEKVKLEEETHIDAYLREPTYFEVANLKSTVKESEEPLHERFSLAKASVEQYWQEWTQTKDKKALILAAKAVFELRLCIRALQSHYVKKGDTMYGIASQWGDPKLVAANIKTIGKENAPRAWKYLGVPYKSSTYIVPGMVLRIPDDMIYSPDYRFYDKKVTADEFSAKIKTAWSE